MDGAALDPLLHQLARLRLMALLSRNQEMAATELRDRLDLTAGNMASHVAKLEQAGYVESRRVLVDLSFVVRVRITDDGRRAFLAYLDALEGLMAEAREGAGSP